MNGRWGIFVHGCWAVQLFSKKEWERRWGMMYLRNLTPRLHYSRDHHWETVKAFPKDPSIFRGVEIWLDFGRCGENEIFKKCGTRGIRHLLINHCPKICKSPRGLRKLCDRNILAVLKIMERTIKWRGGWQVSKVIKEMVAIDCYCNDRKIHRSWRYLCFFLQFTEWKGHDSSSGIVGKFCFFFTFKMGENSRWSLWSLLPFRLDGSSLVEKASGKC